MNVGLHDADATGFPNLALMKLSAWHKALGDTAEWWIPIKEYDRVYSSKVFTFTPDNPYLPENTVKGGTGYGIFDDLPREIEGMRPDYSLYPKCDYAIGFLTRGCIRDCPWCIVRKKEGEIRPCSSWREIKRPDSKRIVFMDNNVLAHRWGVGQIEDMIGKDLRVDFNQGLDARLIDESVAEMLAALKWIRHIRMAADTDEMLSTVIEAIGRLGKNGVQPKNIMVYVLAKDVESAERRAIALREIGAEPFVQPYRDYASDAKPSKELMDLARWANRKAIFKKVKTFKEYNTRKRGRAWT